MKIAITGAARGIGLELTRQLLERGDDVTVGVRNPEESQGLKALAQRFAKTLRIQKLDVSDDKSVQAFAQALGEGPLDVLINNAGVAGQYDAPLAKLDLSDMARTYEVNALSPIRVTRALLPALRKGQGHKVVHVSSEMGLVSANSMGGAYGYRMSKAALNMASSCLALELKGEGILSTVVHPGWVKTDMGGPHAPLTAEQSVSGLLKVLDRLTPADSGKFFSYEGKELAAA